jgi:hypothetical protein
MGREWTGRQHKLRRHPEPQVAPENLKALVEQELIKRETVEGEKAKEAATRIRKAGWWLKLPDLRKASSCDKCSA